MEKKVFFTLSRIKLFSEIPMPDLERFIIRSHAVIKNYEKGGMVFRHGDAINKIGIVLSGCLVIESGDFFGNKTILNRIPSGEIFGEAYAICGEPLMINVSAMEKSAVMFLPVKHIFSGKENNEIRSEIIRKLIIMSSRKNLELSKRILHTSPKTIRGKLVSYLSEQAKLYGLSFSIPFNRQELADYLNADRSAMCAELSKMEKEGLITYRKNEFTINTRNYIAGYR